MKATALRDACLRLPGAREEFPFGEATHVFKVVGKIFALTALSARPLSISLKCDPEIAVALRVEFPAVTAGYHLNKRHWNTVELDGSIPDARVQEMIEDSYDLVVAALPKREQEKLRWVGLTDERS